MDTEGTSCLDVAGAAGFSAPQTMAAIYVVQLSAADGEYFTKVGITSKYDSENSNPFDGLAARARGFYPYRVTACEVRVGSAEVVKDVEAAMIRKLVGLRMGYTPDVPFNGSKKECFRLAYNKMKKLLDYMWEIALGAHTEGLGHRGVD